MYLITLIFVTCFRVDQCCCTSKSMASSKSEETLSNSKNADWMSMLPEDLHSQSLINIALPGKHSADEQLLDIL